MFVGTKYLFFYRLIKSYDEKKNQEMIKYAKQRKRPLKIMSYKMLCFPSI